MSRPGSMNGTVNASPSLSYSTLREIHEHFAAKAKEAAASTYSNAPASAPLPPIHQRHLDENIPASTRDKAAKALRGRSAVLVGLFPHPHTGAVHVLLTQRAADMRSHAGDVAFPGGKLDPTDASDIDCALREASEEIGLSRCSNDTLMPRSVGSGARVISLGRSAVSKNGLEVVPVMAQVPVPAFLLDSSTSQAVATSSPPDSFFPVLNSSEVAVLFSVPLSRFLEAGDGYKFLDIDWLGSRVRMHEFRVTLPKEEWIESEGEKARVETLSVQERQKLTEQRTFRIWGLTAYMLVAAAMQLNRRKPAFSTVAALAPTSPPSKL